MLLNSNMLTSLATPAEQVSYEMYAEWATQELLQPDNIRHYRRKVMEEGEEFLSAELPEDLVEEAGDFMWSLVTGRELTTVRLNLDDLQPEFVTATLASIASSRECSHLSAEALKNGITNAGYLYQRKLHLAATVYDTASEEVKRENIANVINGLFPLLLSAIQEYVQRQTGSTISEVLVTNVTKLEERIATNGLDKAVRAANIEL
jgi:phosphoribosyl-ATP pyrophosphohydrolase